MTDLAAKPDAEKASTGEPAPAIDSAEPAIDSAEPAPHPDAAHTADADAARAADPDADAVRAADPDADAVRAADPDAVHTADPDAAHGAAGTDVADVAPDAHADAPTEAIRPQDRETLGASGVSGGDAGDTVAYAWAPAEPPQKKRRTALWISVGAGAAAIALVASSLVLIAPGTTVAGVPVGFLTPGAAADAIAQRLADTTIVLVADGAEAEVTGADLGASVDAAALAEAAFAKHPLWNPTTWFAAPIEAAVEIDAEAAAGALREAVPTAYEAPVDAGLTYDAASATYVVTPAEPGAGIDVAAVEAALQDAFASGENRAELEVAPVDVEAAITTAAAEEAAARLGGMLDTAGFYVGAERTVPVDRATVASWLTVTPDHDNGTFAIEADAAAIQPIVDTLAGTVNRSPENATVITDSQGSVLDEIAAGQSGRELGDTADVASAFAEQLADGNAVYELPVNEVPVVTTTLARRIEIDISEQRVYIFENGDVVNSYAASTGVDGFDTALGSFRITAKLRSQNMGNRDLTQPPYYFTENVPWVMYYNGDEALHGAYWHNNFGNRMSHGCTNLPVDVAAFLYEWAPMGTEVWVHA